SGANRGTGEVIANHLEREGAQVIRHCNDETSFQQIHKKYPHASAVWGDITNEAGSAHCLSQLWKSVSQIDILINNYGTATAGKWDSFNEADWLDIYQKNVLSSARLIAGISPKMKTLGWGRIIQISTIGSINPNSRMPHYYASKAAMANMTASLAKELS